MYGKHRERLQADEQQQGYTAGQQAVMPAAPAQAPAPSSGITSDDTARLKELGKLHEQGILTDEEFSQQKAIILGRL